jgi:hypothetical protein
MRSALYLLICMVISMAREAGACFSVVDFMSYNHSQTTMLWFIKNKAEL